MRLTILGSGTCIPDATRLPSGYWLEVGEAQIRMDVGPGTVYATTRYPHLDWRAQTHQLLSHFHVDHIGDVATLMFAFKYGRKPTPRGPLTFVGPHGLTQHLERIAAALEPKLFQQEFAVEFLEVADGESHEVAEGVTLRALKVPHTPESLAYRVEEMTTGASLGYTGDTSPDLERLPAFVREVDVLIAECAHEHETSTPHLTIRDVQRLAEEAKPKRLITVHHFFDSTQANVAATLAAELPGVEVQAGHDGLVVEV